MPRPDNTYFDPATCTMYTTQSSRTALKSKLPRPTDLTPMETQLLRDLYHINETLTLEEMKAKEPYFPLPKQYYPRRKLQHQPPIFTFGVVFSLQELKEYAAVARVVGEGHITGKVIYHFNQKLDMPEGYGIFMDIA
ncbi:hypothetical protein BDN72DRAFT_902796 [Pluteus cervinus]|uniref:Uncharacterized protein n=1 Tax=Pluteus cervinus TaxID=181527 RepID=A0ACD3ABP9_9AGAR|nr:hypothetical protein BDN72DRAFT_902796 [Pluteus cervinus]